MSILKVVNPGKTIKNVEKCRRGVFDNSVFGPVVCVLFFDDSSSTLFDGFRVFSFVENFWNLDCFCAKLGIFWVSVKINGIIPKNHQKSSQCRQKHDQDNFSVLLVQIQNNDIHRNYHYFEMVRIFSIGSISMSILKVVTLSKMLKSVECAGVL